MTTKPNFIQLQYTFTQHMRDPDNAPAPQDIETRRMEIYRGLLYRNIEGFMSSSYPVLRKITSADRWHAMIRDYFKRHQSHTPYFPKMPREFLDYLENERNDPDDPPFLFELAHYEWVETAVALDTREIDFESVARDGDMLTGVPVLNPLVRTLTYHYPVQRISPEYQPVSAPEQPTYLVVYRNSEDKVNFIELNPVSARLLELVQKQQGKTGLELLKSIANELDHPDPETVIQGGLQILNGMRENEVVLGTRID